MATTPMQFPDGISAAAISAASLVVSAAAGTERYLEFQTAGASRWRTMAGNAAEAGADAGSNYLIRAFTDAGAVIDTPITITRAAGGSITLARPLVGTTLSLSTPLPVTSGGNGLATAALGDLRYGSAANTLSTLAGNTTATKMFLTQTGTGTVSAAPAWSTIASADIATALTTPGPIGSTTPNTGKFTSVTNSALTSGRVPFATTSGLMTDSAGLTYLTNVLTVGDGTASTIRMDGAAGTQRSVNFRTAGSNRWQVGANGTAESGSNAGSNYVIQAYDDSGVQIDTPLTLNRASGGAAVWSRPLQPGSGSAGAPSFAFSTETNTGIYRPASGVYAIAVGGVDRFRFGSNQFTQNFNTTTTGTGPITSVGAVTIHGADAAASNIAFCAYGNSASVIGRRANGTAAALTALAANDIIFSLNAVGYETVTPAFTTAKQLYRVIAAEAFTDVANGTYQDWYNVPIGSTGATFRMRLNSTGSLLIGTATDGMTAGGSLAVAQDFAHRGANLGLFNTTPIAKKTGYGTPTGNAYQASFAAGSITLPNLAAAVAQLILDLKAYGLIGA